jgi:hypothetical protein
MFQGELADYAERDADEEEEEIFQHGSTSWSFPPVEAGCDKSMMQSENDTAFSRPSQGMLGFLRLGGMVSFPGLGIHRN